MSNVLTQNTYRVEIEITQQPHSKDTQVFLTCSCGYTKPVNSNKQMERKEKRFDTIALALMLYSFHLEAHENESDPNK